MTIVSRQLKVADLAPVRARYLAKQRYQCPICGAPLAGASGTGIALDHCHRTGHIRATICGVCNRNEGKVFKAMRYMALKTHRVWVDPIGWLRALADYLEYHRDHPSGLIHPSFDLKKGKQKPKARPKSRVRKK